MPDEDTSSAAKAQAVFDTLEAHDAVIDKLQRDNKIILMAVAGCCIVTGGGIVMSMKCVKAVAQIGQVLNNWSPIVGAMAEVQQQAQTRTVPARQPGPMRMEARVPPEASNGNGTEQHDDVAPAATGPVSETPAHVAEDMASDPVDPALLDQVLGELREG